MAKVKTWEKREPYGEGELEKVTIVKEAINGYVIKERICGYKEKDGEYYEEEKLMISEKNPMLSENNDADTKSKVMSAILSEVGNMGMKTY